MTPELKMQLRIAILESLGWHIMRPVINRCILARKSQKDGWSGPPDPTNCLNAMHDAENGLTDAQHRLFRDELWRQIDPEAGTETGTEQAQERLYQSRTADQRAEAYCRALKIGPFAE